MLQMLWENTKDVFQLILWPAVKVAFSSIFGGLFDGIQIGGGGFKGFLLIGGVHLAYALLLALLLWNVKLHSYRRRDRFGTRAGKTFKFILWALFLCAFPVINHFLLDYDAQKLIFSLITAIFTSCAILLKMHGDGKRRNWALILMVLFFVYALIKNFILLWGTSQLVWAQIQTLVTAYALWFLAEIAVESEQDEKDAEEWDRTHPPEVMARREQEKWERREKRRQEREDRMMQHYRETIEAIERENRMSPDERAMREERATGITGQDKCFRRRSTAVLSSENCKNCRFYDAGNKRCSYSYKEIDDPLTTTCKGYQY